MIPGRGRRRDERRSARLAIAAPKDTMPMVAKACRSWWEAIAEHSYHPLVQVDLVNGAGRGRFVVVRGCPLGPGGDRCEWHASGTAAEEVPGIQLRGWARLCVVSGGPRVPGGDRYEWRARGTAAEDVPGIQLRGWLHSDRRLRP